MLQNVDFAKKLIVFEFALIHHEVVVFQLLRIGRLKAGFVAVQVMTIGDLPVDKHTAILRAGFKGKGLVRVQHLVTATPG